MLAACVMMIYLFMAVLFFFTDLSYPVQYDYIIVGGGPAGSVVARRLVDEGAKVLLIEAGDATQYDLGGTDYYSAPLTRFDIPLLWPSISKSSSFQWSGFNSTKVLLTKGLGGCGVSSGLIYMRALASDIGNWNVEGWTWKNVLGKYQSLESFIPSANTSSASGVNEVAWFHGGAGPIVTSTQQYIDKVASFFVSAAANSGLSLVDDFNDPSVSRAGAGIYHVNTVRGRRDSAARALLGPLLTSSGKRPNFFLTLNATVLRVMLTKETVFSSDLSVVAESYRAVGVEYRQGLSDEIKTAYLTSGPSKPEKEGSMDTEGRRHVVLTAGAVMTPKILLNSGVGSKVALDAAGIPLKVSSPQVGRNLQDHPAVGMVFTLEDSIAASKFGEWLLSLYLLTCY
jgi:choline dehydrogenase